MADDQVTRQYPPGCRRYGVIRNLAGQQWNGSAWESFGSGVNGTVMDLAVFRDDLFIGGDFTRAGGVPVEDLARWDGEEWTAVRDVPFNEISALTTFGSHHRESEPGRCGQLLGPDSARYLIAAARNSLNCG